MGQAFLSWRQAQADGANTHVVSFACWLARAASLARRLDRPRRHFCQFWRTRKVPAGHSVRAGPICACRCQEIEAILREQLADDQPECLRVASLTRRGVERDVTTGAGELACMHGDLGATYS